MNRAIAVVATPSLRVERFDHPPGEAHHDPDAECAGGYAISFIEAGRFLVRPRGGAWQVADTRHLFVTAPGFEFSCAHEEETPTDRCLSICYTEASIESARSEGLAWTRAPLVRATNRTAYLHHRLSACGPGEEAHAEALAGALLWATCAGPRPRAVVRADRLRWYAARVDRAKALMEARYGEALSLTTLARAVGMSVHHFARVFAELEGTPPHRYLASVRLARAQALLLEGASVTETSLAVGFGSLSHFVTTFRQQFGVTPGVVRRAATDAHQSAARRSRA